VVLGELLELHQRAHISPVKFAGGLIWIPKLEDYDDGQIHDGGVNAGFTVPPIAGQKQRAGDLPSIHMP